VQITFLGTSSGVPTRSRNVSSVALRLPQRAEVWLFDCGEATQHQFLRSEFKSSQIRRIFVTHMHGDHIFGLMGLLASCGLAGNRQQRIDIYGPKPLNDYLQACRRYSHTHFTLPIQVHAVEPGVVFEDEDYRVLCDRLEHRIPAYGYRVEERDRPGHFDVKRAEALGIPPGPIYGQLKRGQRVKLADGRTVHGADFCGPDLVGRKLVYCTDTIYCERSVDLAQGADVLIHEATFSHRDADLAYQRLHSTSTMAAQVALAGQVKQLIMTHFSPRYAPGNDLQLSDLLAEAQAIFPQTIMASDLMIHEIPRQSEKTLVSSAW
jgi:ribonuclease Z